METLTLSPRNAERAIVALSVASAASVQDLALTAETPFSPQSDAQATLILSASRKAAGFLKTRFFCPITDPDEVASMAALRVLEHAQKNGAGIFTSLLHAVRFARRSARLIVWDDIAALSQGRMSRLAQGRAELESRTIDGEGFGMDLLPSMPRMEARADLTGALVKARAVMSAAQCAYLDAVQTGTGDIEGRKAHARIVLHNDFKVSRSAAYRLDADVRNIVTAAVWAESDAPDMEAPQRGKRGSRV